VALPKTNAKIKIMDDDAGATIRLQITSADMSEDGGKVSMVIVASHPPSQPVSVGIRLSGTARLSEDFSITSTLAVIPAGKASTVIEITSLSDDKNEGSEDIVVELINPVGAVLAKEGTTAILQIIDGKNISSPEDLISGANDGTGGSTVGGGDGVDSGGGSSFGCMHISSFPRRK